MACQPLRRVRGGRAQEERRVGIDCGAGETKELFAFRPGIGREQLLGLVEAENGKRVRRLAEKLGHA